MSPREAFDEAAALVPGAVKSPHFGKAGWTVDDKVFCFFWQDNGLFKLAPADRETALQWPGVSLHEMGGRVMKEWVRVPVAHAHRWPGLAQAAALYVHTHPPKARSKANRAN